MCGIVGMLGFQGCPIDPGLVHRAACRLRHRGPDGEGYLLLHTPSGEFSLRNGPDTPAGIHHPPLEAPAGFVPDLVLGHRRLAIIDLSPGGHEPMTVDGGRLWITFNGEIYNYLELREDLQALGYQFHTGSDVEVLLCAYQQWGPGCLERLIGMFAFALWDQDRRRLWCVRDRLGIKPLYYTVGPDSFAFASEIKALRVMQPGVCRPDMTQLWWFLQEGQVYSAPTTFFEGVRELPGGHYLMVEDGVVGEPMRWWDVDLERARTLYRYDNPEDQLMRLLRDSIRLRLRSDVPVGTCLSGGLDSSTIVALATEQLNGGRMNSFSALYPVKGLDETRYVDLVAGRFNTIAHRVTPQPEGFIQRLGEITWHQDIPTAGAGVYTQNFVMQLAQGRVTVLLDGQGGDELFAGYLRHVLHYLRNLRRRPLRWAVEQAAFAASVWGRFNAALSLREFAFRVYGYLRTGGQQVRLLRDEPDRLAHRRSREITPLRLPGADSLNSYLYQTIVRDTIPGLLHYEDRNSMAYGIEARVPFLDHRLVEFALGVPAGLKIRPPETKWFMRRAVRGLLPDEVVDRRDKLGYPTPFAAWLRGPLRSEIEAFLFDRVIRREWLDPGRVRQMWRYHQQGWANFDAAIYRLITAEQWITDVAAD